jgi:hypothetical protein
MVGGGQALVLNASQKRLIRRYPLMLNQCFRLPGHLDLDIYLDLDLDLDQGLFVFLEAVGNPDLGWDPDSFEVAEEDLAAARLLLPFREFCPEPPGWFGCGIIWPRCRS